MNQAQLINLSLEQVADKLGDPTQALFDLLFQRHPELADFASEDDSWQHYMVQEILGNIMAFGDDPETALTVIREMTEHHRMIGLSSDIFKGMYQVMLDTFIPLFQGDQREPMVLLWQDTVARINHSIDACHY